MRTMSCGAQANQFASGQILMDEVPDALWRDAVLGTLQDERRDGQEAKVRAIIREESDASEMFGDLRVGAAEALGKLGRQFRPFFVLHDDGRHSSGPPEVILVEGLEESVDVGSGKPAHVIILVDIAGGRAYEYEALKGCGLLNGG